MASNSTKHRQVSFFQLLAAPKFCLPFVNLTLLYTYIYMTLFPINKTFPSFEGGGIPVGSLLLIGKHYKGSSDLYFKNIKPGQGN